MVQTELLVSSHFRSASLFVAGVLLYGFGCSERQPTSQEAEVPAPAQESTHVPKEIKSTPKPLEEKPIPPQGENVVMIVIDTLRADRLGSYGYKEQPTTPTLDRLAAEGILFERFHAASPWTAPSFGSMLTGFAPKVHRAGQRLGKLAKTGEKIMGIRVAPINDKLKTLGELLGDIKSAAIMNNSFLNPVLGYERGFDHYDHRNSGLSKCRRADEVTKRAVEWMEKNRDGRFFLLVHYFDPHISYDPPAKYRAEFAPGPSGRIKAPFIDHRPARSGELDPSPKEAAFIRGLYNGEVRFVDDQIDVLLKEMGRLDILDKSWIVATSDHGEEQFDHGSFDHGHRYEDEVTRVPLIIRAPGGKWRAGSKVEYSARHIDLLPTILEWFNIKPPSYLPGRSVMPLINGEEEKHRLAYMEYNLYWKEQCALYDGRYKLIRNVNNDHGYLYDLKNDPGEKQRLDAEHPRYKELENQLLKLRKDLDALAKLNPSRNEAVKLPPEMERSLRSLGYIE